MPYNTIVLSNNFVVIGEVFPVFLPKPKLVGSVEVLFPVIWQFVSSDQLTIFDHTLNLNHGTISHTVKF